MNLHEYVHILNPNKSNRRAVARFFKKHPKLKSIWIDRTSHPTHLETVVDWALVEGWDKIAVWGGDGTLSRVLQFLNKNKKLDDVTLCLIPVGTCNDFARKAIGRTWKQFIKGIDQTPGQTKHFDLGQVQFNGTSHVFVNNSGFGRSKKALERKHSKPLKDIQEFQKKRIQLEWKTPKVNQYETLWAFFGIVFNSPFFNKGMHFDKNISPEDGILNAFIVPPQSESEMLFKFLKTKFGSSLKSRKDLRIDAEFLSVESDQILYPQADGEVLSFDGTHKLQFNLIPKAFKMVVP